jgi:hypothetical protein
MLRCVCRTMLLCAVYSSPARHSAAHTVHGARCDAAQRGAGRGDAVQVCGVWRVACGVWVCLMYALSSVCVVSGCVHTSASIDAPPSARADHRPNPPANRAAPHRARSFGTKATNVLRTTAFTSSQKASASRPCPATVQSQIRPNAALSAPVPTKHRCGIHTYFGKL